MTETSVGTFSSIFGSAETEAGSHEALAAQLLREGFLLTALEFHAELLERGLQLPSLAEQFSGGGEEVGAARPASRTNSHTTLDSLDQLTRYSEATTSLHSNHGKLSCNTKHPTIRILKVSL